MEAYFSAYRKYIPDLLAGKKVPSIESNEEYGYVLTVLTPVYDAEGVCRCYVGADCSLDRLRDYVWSIIRQIAFFFLIVLALVLIAGALFTKDQTTLILCARGRTTYSIPSSVTCIGDLAFSGCRCLSSVEIPSSVVSIGDRAFSDCLSLSSLAIPSGVTGIGDDAFEDCPKLTLRVPKGSYAEEYAKENEIKYETF